MCLRKIIFYSEFTHSVYACLFCFALRFPSTYILVHLCLWKWELLLWKTHVASALRYLVGKISPYLIMRILCKKDEKICWQGLEGGKTNDGSSKKLKKEVAQAKSKRWEKGSLTLIYHLQILTAIKCHHCCCCWCCCCCCCWWCCALLNNTNVVRTRKKRPRTLLKIMQRTLGKTKNK